MQALTTRNQYKRIYIRDPHGVPALVLEKYNATVQAFLTLPVVFTSLFQTGGTIILLKVLNEGS